MTKRLSWILFTQLQGMADHIGIHFPVYTEGNGEKTKQNRKDYYVLLGA